MLAGTHGITGAFQILRHQLADPQRCSRNLARLLDGFEAGMSRPDRPARPSGGRGSGAGEGLWQPGPMHEGSRRAILAAFVGGRDVVPTAHLVFLEPDVFRAAT